jgi:hypothetical protein
LSGGILMEPLVKQKVEIPFIKGLNQGVTSELLEMGAMTKLENLIMDKAGKLRKRPGWTPLTKDAEQNGARVISSARSIHSYRDTLYLTGSYQVPPLTIEQTSTFMYRETVDKWFPLDTGADSKVSIKGLAGGFKPPDLTAYDMASSPAYSVFAYQTETGIFVRVIDRASGNEIPIRNSNMETNAGQAPSVVYMSHASGSGFFIFYRQTTAIKFVYIDETAPFQLATTPTNFISPLAAGVLFDTDVSSSDGVHQDQLLFSYTNPAATVITELFSYSGTPTFSSLWVRTFIAAAAVLSVCSKVLVSSDGVTKHFAVFSASTGNVLIYSWDLAGVAQAVGVSTGIPAALVTTITVSADYGFGVPSSKHRVWVQKHITTTFPRPIIDTCFFDLLYAVSSVRTFSVGIICGKSFSEERRSKIPIQAIGQEDWFVDNLATNSFPFTSYSKTVICFFDIDRIYPDTYLLSDFSGSPSWRFGRLCKVEVEGKKALFLGLKAIEASGTSIPPSAVAIKSFLVNFQNIIIERDKTKSVSGNGLFNGGIPSILEQVTPAETLPLSPPRFNLGSTVNVGTWTALGTYLFAAVAIFMDSHGNIHRGAPSFGKVFNPLTNNRTVLFTIFDGISKKNPYLAGDILKNGMPDRIGVEIYATVSAGSVYHFLGAGPFNSTLEIAGPPNGSEKILYTDGGVLPNDPLPASNIAFANANRIFAVPEENKKTVLFSKTKQPDLCYEFNANLFAQTDEDKDITGVAQIDSNTIIFKDSSIYAFSGDGPNSLGQGGFTPPFRISSDVGCTETASVLMFDDGVVFKSKKGFCLLDRSLQVQYIGDPVKDFNSFTVLKAVIHPKEQRLYFFHESSGDPAPVLVYDYLHKFWSNHTHRPVVDACLHNDLLHTVSSDGQVGVQQDTDTNQPSDDGEYIQSSLRTGWLRPSEITGFNRLWFAALLGKYFDEQSHELEIKTYYDYTDVDNTFVEEQYLSSNPRHKADNVSLVLSDALFDPDALLMRWKPKLQKANAYMFEISDYPWVYRKTITDRSSNPVADKWKAVASRGTSWIVAGETSGSRRVFLSLDNGITWADVTPTAAQSPLDTDSLEAACELGSTAAFAVAGENGAFLVTTNSGSTWTEYQVVGSETSQILSIVGDTNTVYVLNDDQQLYKNTTPGSFATWTLLKTFTNFMTKLVRSGSNMVAVGEGGVIEASSNNGSSWTVKNAFSAPVGQLNAVNFLDENLTSYWIAMGEDQLVFTSDANNPVTATWTQQTTTGLEDADNIYGIATDKEGTYAAGDVNGENGIFWSRDNITWVKKPIALRNGRVLYALDHRKSGGAFRLVAAGDGGALFSFLHETAIGAASFRGSEWIGLTLEVGVKKGILKASESRSI